MTAAPSDCNSKGNIIGDKNHAVCAYGDMTTCFVIVRETDDDAAARSHDKSIYPASKDFVAHMKNLRLCVLDLLVVEFVGSSGNDAVADFKHILAHILVICARYRESLAVLFGIYREQEIDVVGGRLVFFADHGRYDHLHGLEDIRLRCRSLTEID